MLWSYGDLSERTGIHEEGIFTDIRPLDRKGQIDEVAAKFDRIPKFDSRIDSVGGLLSQKQFWRLRQLRHEYNVRVN